MTAGRSFWGTGAIFCAVAAASILSYAAPAHAQITKGGDDMDALVRAPEFPKGYAWLNTEKPLRFSDELKGQVVVLDFWTYCCINCMHVLPDLEYLEQKYKDQPVVVMGVHSAKYDNEGDAANIRAAIQRYGIHHPVIVDEKHTVWDAFAVSSWPTLVVVGPDGRIVGGTSGEGKRDLLDKVIERVLAESKSRGTLAKEPLKLAKEGQVRAASGLSFPAKVVADVAGKRLFIIDSNHHRIVVTTWPGDDGRCKVDEIIGSGKLGASDGDFATASFNRPQGATVAGNVLWVADTENHLIRRVNLEKKTVVTVLGTGKQVFDPEAGKSGRAQGLNSPWDVALLGNRLYIAQAGQHQLFAMNIMTGMAEVVAGTARENIRDGDAADANLAQPSGLALDSKNQILYFADSEVSAVRGLDLKKKEVFTVVGEGLFDFGDIDGKADVARLQHPLGVSLTADGTKLLLADTYNHKIKEIDPEKRTVRTLAGTGKAGVGVIGGKVQFFEPAGVTAAGEHEIYVADTNNHRIVRFDPANGAWKEIMIEGLGSPEIAADMIDKDARDAGSVTLQSEKGVAIELSIKLPPLAHFTENAPISVKVTDGAKVIYTGSLNGTGPLRGMIPAEALNGKPAQLYITAFYAYCLDGPAAVCTPAQSSWKLSIKYDVGGSAELKLGI